MRGAGNEILKHPSVEKPMAMNGPVNSVRSSRERRSANQKLGALKERERAEPLG